MELPLKVALCMTCAFAAGAGVMLAGASPRADATPAERRAEPPRKRPMIVGGSGRNMAGVVSGGGAARRNAGSEGETARPGDDLAREFDAVELPRSGTGDDPQVYRTALHVAMRRLADAAAKLHHAHPEHPRTAFAMRRRWEALTNTLGEARAAFDEAGEIAMRSSGELRDEAVYARARAALVLSDASSETLAAWTDEAVNAIGANERTASLLLDLAVNHASDPAVQRAIAERVESGFDVPASGFGLKPKHARRLADLAGTTPALAFADAITAQPVDIARMRNAPLVIVAMPNIGRSADGFDPHAVRESFKAWRRKGVGIVAVFDRPTEKEWAAAQEFIRGCEHGVCCLVERGNPFESIMLNRFGINHRPLFVLLDRDGRVVLATGRLGTITQLVQSSISMK